MTHTKQTWDLKCWSPLLIWKFLNITLIYSAFPLGTFHTLHVVCLSLNKHYSESACVRSLQALDIQRLRRRSCCPKETHNQWRERERETQESFLDGERGHGKGLRRWQSVPPVVGGGDSGGREGPAIKDCFLEEETLEWRPGQTEGNSRQREQRE